MRTYRKNGKLFRTASLGLLAGCLWFSGGTAAFAQEGQNNDGQGNTTSPQTPAQPARTDAQIQSDVGYALTHDPALQGLHITCATADGIVNLSGTVQTNAQFQQAETMASNVPGVSGIVNNIKVANPSSPEPPAADQAAANTVNPDAAAQLPPPPPPDQPGTQAAPGQMSPGQAPPANNSARVPYQPGYYPAPQQSYSIQAPPPPTGPVTIPTGTLVRVRLSETLDTAHLKSGTYFEATAANDVYQGGVLAIPRGAVLQGQVVKAKDAGPFGGSAELELQLTGINLEGKVYPIATDAWSNKGPNKAGYTAANTVGGAAVGALIGGIIGRGAGAAIGAGVGGAAGLGVSSATNGPRLVLPAESQVDFHLASPATVQPVSMQEAQRLASSSVPQQPRLIVRPAPVYAPAPYPYAPYPYYAYPYPYYYGR